MPVHHDLSKKMMFRRDNTDEGKTSHFAKLFFKTPCVSTNAKAKQHNMNTVAAVAAAVAAAATAPAPHQQNPKFSNPLFVGYPQICLDIH